LLVAVIVIFIVRTIVGLVALLALYHGPDTLYSWWFEPAVWVVALLAGGVAYWRSAR
jgi:hypothetical protein